MSTRLTDLACIAVAVLASLELAALDDPMSRHRQRARLSRIQDNAAVVLVTFRDAARNLARYAVRLAQVAVR